MSSSQVSSQVSSSTPPARRDAVIIEEGNHPSIQYRVVRTCGGSADNSPPGNTKSEIAEQIVEAKQWLATAGGFKQGNEEVFNMAPLIALKAVHPSKLAEKENPKSNLDEIEEISPAAPDHGSKPAKSSVSPMAAELDFHASPEKAESVSSANGSDLKERMKREGGGEGDGEEDDG